MYSIDETGDIDWTRIADGIDSANVPTLILCLFQMTGDEKWLKAPYTPRRERGIDNNDTGGLSGEIQAEIRAAAKRAITDWLRGKPLALERPDDPMLAHMLQVSMQEPVPAEYGEIIASGMNLDLATEPRAFDTLKAIIVGGGIAGVAAAVEMDRRGVSYVLLEKNDDLGGTWWENRYPGCGVDTPSLTYTFAFEANDWQKYFPLRDEIASYIHRTARQHGVYDRARLQTKVERAEWIDQDKCWQVTITTSAGASETLRADLLFSAVGILNIPRVPDIPGMDSFPGVVAHTSRWPEELSLSGKRVAVVGNGASAMQFVPEIADQVDELIVFAKSKQWAAPFPQFRQEVPESLRYLIAKVPLYRQWFEQRLTWVFNDRLYNTMFHDPDWTDPRSINAINDRHREYYTDYIRSELGDRADLLPKLLPEYPPYLKRMLMDNGWFRTMTKPNVRLIPDRLARVSGNRLTAASDETAEADVLVLATGYAASEMLSSFEVVGRDGRILRDFWEGDDVAAYLGTLVPGFPNMFILVGPNTGSGHGGSMMRIMENQIHYSASVIERMLDRAAQSIEVREDVYESYRREVDAMHDKLMWSHRGTDNWYRNSRGRVTAITPWRNDKFWRMTRAASEDDLLFGGGSDAGRQSPDGSAAA